MDKLSSANISSCRTKSTVFSLLVLSLGLIFILGQFSSVNCALPLYDVDTNRQALLDTLRQLGLYHDFNLNSVPDSVSDFKEIYPKYHLMERKGGRAPTLRLRFGRRSDPAWSPLLGKSNSQENVN